MDLIISWRNIWRNPRRTVIIMIAVVIGVLSMIALTAFMRGMVVDMIENGIETLTGDVKIYRKGYRSDPALENRIQDPGALVATVRQSIPESAKLATRIRVNAIAQNARHSAGVELIGIDPQMEKGVSFIGDGVSRGRPLSASDRNAVVVGRALLAKFDTEIGNKLILMSENAENEIASRAFRIRGVYETTLASTEKRYVFVHTEAARKMLGIGGGVSEISVVLPDHQRAGEMSDRIAAQIDTSTYSVASWEELLPMLKAYIGVFNGFIVLWYIVVFVAMAFGIINTTLMAVFERMREFGLLKALGMRPWRILRSVLLESGFILVIGAAAGNTLALSLVHILGRVGIDLTAFAAGFEYAGMSAIIYPEIFAGDVAVANLVVIVLGLAVSAYPAAKAARIMPVEAMRYT
jgi:ABC-type lipoprotein release transport system permease subunit